MVSIPELYPPLRQLAPQLRQLHRELLLLLLVTQCCQLSARSTCQYPCHGVAPNVKNPPDQTMYPSSKMNLIESLNVPGGNSARDDHQPPPPPPPSPAQAPEPPAGPAQAVQDTLLPPEQLMPLRHWFIKKSTVSSMQFPKSTSTKLQFWCKRTAKMHFCQLSFALSPGRCSERV